MKKGTKKCLASIWQYKLVSFIGSQCVPIEEQPYYHCLGCPEGFTGNGTNCHDLDEVEFFKISK